jgi:quinol monooxygenase YgiN
MRSGPDLFIVRSRGIGDGTSSLAWLMNENAFGAVLQMTVLPGKRDEAIRIITNYAATLDGEPGTTLFAAAADPNAEDLIWLWEEFADVAAVRDHFAHDFFRALQLELAELLAEPAAVRPLAPFARRVNPGVTTE